MDPRYNAAAAAELERLLSLSRYQIRSSRLRALVMSCFIFSTALAAVNHGPGSLVVISNGVTVMVWILVGILERRRINRTVQGINQMIASYTQTP